MMLKINRYTFLKKGQKGNAKDSDCSFHANLLQVFQRRGNLRHFPIDLIQYSRGRAEYIFSSKLYQIQVGLTGLGVTCSPRDPRFAGSNPAEVDGFFQEARVLKKLAYEQNLIGIFTS